MSERMFKVSTTNTRVSYRWPRYWSFAVPMISWSESNQLHQAFSQVFNVMNLYFIHALLYTTPEISKFKAHDDPGPL